MFYQSNTVYILLHAVVISGLNIRLSSTEHYIGSTIHTLHDRQNTRQRKLRQLKRAQPVSCELALHWFCSQNNHHQFVALPLLPTNTTLQTRTLESYIIQKWCPPLNYPFILPVYLTTTSHKTTFNTTLTTSTTHHLFGNRTPALRSALCATHKHHRTHKHQHLSTNILSDSTTTLPSRTHFTTLNATTVCHRSFQTAFCSNSTTTTTTTYGTHRPTANTSTICQLCVYTTSILSRFQHTTSQHSHAMSSATTTLQRSHTQSSALTTTIWIIRHLPVYTTVNKHNTSTTTTSHAIFTAISNHYSFNSTTEPQQAQRYTISQHTQEAQIHHQATQTTQIYKPTLLLRQTC